MNVFVYLDDWGKWCVAHRPPEGTTYLMVSLPPGVMPVFIDDQATEVLVTP